MLEGAVSQHSLSSTAPRPAPIHPEDPFVSRRRLLRRHPDWSVEEVVSLPILPYVPLHLPVGTAPLYPPFTLRSVPFGHYSALLMLSPLAGPKS